MKFLIYDTETTGLPIKQKNNQPIKFMEYPHIVQFSFIIYDTETSSIVKIFDEIIHLRDNVLIPQETINIHGVTNEMSQQSTMTINYCLINFMNECKNVDLIVGHNLEFDNKMVIAELLREIKLNELKMIKEESESKAEEVNIDDILILNIVLQDTYDDFMALTKFYCTMQTTITFCNIKYNYKNSTKQFVKFPKLIELHDKLFGKDSINVKLHNSLNDVFVCFRCFYKLKYDEDIFDIIKDLITIN